MSPGGKVVDLALLLDRQITQAVMGTAMINGLDPVETAAFAVSVAGLIAGRAEYALERDPEGQKLYDIHRGLGREMAIDVASAMKKGMN